MVKVAQQSCLCPHIPEIMRRWQETLDPSREAPILASPFEAFLEDLAEALESGHPPERRARAASPWLFASAACESAPSLDQILAGYHRLHRVVVELLEADSALSRDLRFYLEDAFHEAERQAVSAYVEWGARRQRELDQSALQERTDELTRTSARMNQFLAMIAHELRTPLSAISNALYVLENLSLPEKADRQVTRASRQARQAARLISDLLDLSRITRGKIELRTEQISLRRVAADAVESMRPLFDSHGHQVTTRYDSDPLLINADPTRVEQIISNLLTNAAKYTDPGGQIDVALQRQGDTAILRVRDSGIGIDPNKLPHIFNLYEQFGLSETRSHGGLGIGLSLVKLLVGLHGGAVAARSEGVGQGSEFEVRFPLVVPGTPAERVPPQGSSRARWS